MVAFSVLKRRAPKNQSLFTGSRPPPKPFAAAGDWTALQSCRSFDPLATQEMEPAAGVSEQKKPALNVRRCTLVPLERLRRALKSLPPGAPVALQIQRDQKLLFVAFTPD